MISKRNSGESFITYVHEPRVRRSRGKLPEYVAGGLSALSSFSAQVFASSENPRLDVSCIPSVCFEDVAKYYLMLFGMLTARPRSQLIRIHGLKSLPERKGF